MSTFALNDVAPLSLAQSFEAPATPWGETWWGPGLFFEDAALPPIEGTLAATTSTGTLAGAGTPIDGGIGTIAVPIGSLAGAGAPTVTGGLSRTEPATTLAASDVVSGGGASARRRRRRRR